MSWVREFLHDGERVRVGLRHLGGARYAVAVGGRVHEVEATPLPDGRVRCTLGAQVFEADAAPCGRALQVRVGGRTWRLEPAEGRRAHAAAHDGVIEAPMTGTVVQVLVAAGDAVTAEQTIAVLSAMKIEHKLTAGIDGVVAELAAAAGATVEQGTVLARITPQGQPPPQKPAPNEKT